MVGYIMSLTISIAIEGSKNHEKWSKSNFENIFWYGRSAKMAKTTIEKPVLNFGLKSTFFGNLGN